MLIRIFGHEWKSQGDGKKYSFIICTPPNRPVISVIISRKVKWVGRVGRM